MNWLWSLANVPVILPQNKLQTILQVMYYSERVSQLERGGQ